MAFHKLGKCSTEVHAWLDLRFPHPCDDVPHVWNSRGESRDGDNEHRSPQTFLSLGTVLPLSNPPVGCRSSSLSADGNTSQNGNVKLFWSTGYSRAPVMSDWKYIEITTCGPGGSMLVASGW